MLVLLKVNLGHLNQFRSQHRRITPKTLTMGETVVADLQH
jgi:hypothetical protein